ncbi:MAG: 5-formyltetrahydrofolate cyclo-ligase [Pseudomonadota bacterium]
MNPAKGAEKAQLRSRFESFRDGLSSEERALASSKICSRLAKFIEEIRGLSEVVFVGSYKAFRSEVDLSSLDEPLHHVAFAYPKVTEPNSGQMEFLAGRSFQPGPFGIEEPAPDSTRHDDEIQVLLVPGLAFDRRGGRLGYGKGFYDRWLQKRSVLKVGVAFSQQMSDQDFLREQHDVPMDFVVTEKYILGTPMASLTSERAV